MSGTQKRRKLQGAAKLKHALMGWSRHAWTSLILQVSQGNIVTKRWGLSNKRGTPITNRSCLLTTCEWHPKTPETAECRKAQTCPNRWSRHAWTSLILQVSRGNIVTKRLGLSNKRGTPITNSSCLLTTCEWHTKASETAECRKAQKGPHRWSRHAWTSLILQVGQSNIVTKR